jgi:hypothetical protein
LPGASRKSAIWFVRRISWHPQYQTGSHDEYSGRSRGSVEIWRGDPMGPVSRSRSSNRVCGFPATGFRTRDSALLHTVMPSFAFAQAVKRHLYRPRIYQVSDAQKAALAATMLRALAGSTFFPFGRQLHASFTGVSLESHSEARSIVGISCFRELPRLLGWRLALSAESQWPQNPSIQHPKHPLFAEKSTFATLRPR